MALQETEGRATIFIQRYNLTVDHRFIRQFSKRRCNLCITRCEIVIIARPQLHLPFSLNREYQIAVEFDPIP